MSEPHLCGLEYGLVLDFCGHGSVSAQCKESVSLILVCLFCNPTIELSGWPLRRLSEVTAIIRNMPTDVSDKPSVPMTGS